MRKRHFMRGFALSFVMICAVAAFEVERFCAQQSDGSLKEDWRGLRALYIATDGDNWRNNTNWNVTDGSVVTAASLAAWHGIEVAMGRVTKVRLPENRLAGVLPPELAGLSMLQVLDLRDNNLTGKIPLELGMLAELRELNLGDKDGVLGHNALEGAIPPELGNLANLRYLFLQNNALTGEIPSELANLRQLVYVVLGGNELEGEIPAGLGSLANLQLLGLPDNALTGEIPSELVNLRQLERLWLGGNELEGEIPAGLGSLANLQLLGLPDNALTGEIPSELANLGQLEDLWLGGNELEGEIPAGLGSLANLGLLSLPDNSLTGEIPSELANLGQLEALYLSNNELEGEIPAGLGNLSRLVVLQLEDNALIGALPMSLTNLQGLRWFYFSGQPLCAPLAPDFQAWLQAIEYHCGENCEPLSFAESIPDQRFTKGVDIGALLLPAADGGAPPVVYDLIPELPLGLVFDADSLKVHGTPGEVSAPRTYTFSGVDAAGSTAELDFSVQVVAAPLGFERDIPDQSYIEGQVITPLNLPEATGGAGLVSYMLPPDLPPGLVFTASTRTLSGTPTDVFQRKTYRYVANDEEEATGEQTFSIEVNPSAFAFDGAVADQTYTPGEAIPVLTFPEARAGVLPYTYSLVPALPAGLVFDATAHTLSGTPTAVFPRELYRYSAGDAIGAMAELTLYIQVDERTFSQRAGRALPAEFLLRGSFPHPFATMAFVEFDLPQRARITLEVHNLLGQRVLAWPPKEMEAGWGRRLKMDGLVLPSGTYVYRITADMGTRASVRSARMVVLR